MNIFKPSDRSQAAGALARLNTSVAAKLLHSPDRRARWLARAALGTGVGAFTLTLNGQPITLNSQRITLTKAA